MPVGIAFIVSLGCFCLRGNLGFNLADEGSLWYGVIHAAHGEVPLLDFQSYDCGRHYAAVVWSWLMGEGILSLRLFLYLLGGIGMTFGLLAARRAVGNGWRLAATGLLLGLWMFPVWKLVDHAVLLGAIYVGTLLAEGPNRWRCFWAGLFVGLVAIIGRNHGLYSGAAFGAIILFLSIGNDWRDGLRRLGAFVLGAFVGYLPMIGMLALIPGLWTASIHATAVMTRYGGTNLPLAVPWPWRATGSNWLQQVSGWVCGALFLMLPISYIGLVMAALVCFRERLKERSLLLACAALGPCYLNHIFPRADLPHLAQGIHPFLLGTMAATIFVPLARRRAIVQSLLLCFLILISSIAAWRENPFRLRWQAGKEWQRCQVGADWLYLPSDIKRFMDQIPNLKAITGPGRKDMLIAPNMAGFYPLLDRDSPVWEIYFVFPSSPSEELTMIQQLEQKRVRWFLFRDVAFDNMEERRFRVTHPLLTRYIQEHFDKAASNPLEGDYDLFQRRDAL